MQLIALDDQGKRIIAPHAQKQIDYRCPECSSSLRLRQGPHVQAHFYHYRPLQHCERRKKTLAHISNQLYLIDKLPQGEALLEHPFPSIKRIADLYWPQQKIVFEIQCSPLTAAEAEERERDYGCLGLTVIWILHEARYNRRRLSAAERFCTLRHAYYTSISSLNEGVIYDQFEIIQGERRAFTGARFPINPSLPYQVEKKTPPSLPLPETILDRLKRRSWGFTGDLLDIVCSEKTYDYSSLIALEKRYSANPPSAPSFGRRLLNGYRTFLYALLEKTL